MDRPKPLKQWFAELRVEEPPPQPDWHPPHADEPDASFWIAFVGWAIILGIALYGFHAVKVLP